MGDKNPWTRETARDELHHCVDHPGVRGPENGRDACQVRNKINDLVPTNICALLPGFSFFHRNLHSPGSRAEYTIYRAFIKGHTTVAAMLPSTPSTSEHSRRVPQSPTIIRHGGSLEPIILGVYRQCHFVGLGNAVVSQKTEPEHLRRSCRNLVRHAVFVRRQFFEDLHLACYSFTHI